MCFFQPSLEQCAKQGSTLEGCCDGAQRLQEILVQTQAWFDSRALSQVAPASGPDPVVSKLRAAHALASAGVALVKSGCGVKDPATAQKELHGELATAMRALTEMPLGEVGCPLLSDTVAAWEKGGPVACGDGA